MQQEANSTNGNSFWSSLGGAVTDFAGAYGQAYIDDKYGESSSEQSEGPTEFANPQTVTQPVYQSNLASGLPLNFNSVASRLGISVSALLAILAGGVYFIFLRK